MTERKHKYIMLFLSGTSYKTKVEETNVWARVTNFKSKIAMLLLLISACILKHHFNYLQRILISLGITQAVLLFQPLRHLPCRLTFVFFCFVEFEISLGKREFINKTKCTLYFKIENIMAIIQYKFPNVLSSMSMAS